MKKIAILLTHGFEYSELVKPQEFFKDKGYTVEVISPNEGSIEAAMDKGSVQIDKTLDQASPEDYDALILPGGLVNPDILRTNESAVEFVRHFTDSSKPVAAVCHGPWILVEVDAVRNKKVTSWISLKTDLINAGAEWIDQSVVVDGNLVTGRKPSDLDAFNDAFEELLK